MIIFRTGKSIMLRLLVIFALLQLGAISGICQEKVSKNHISIFLDFENVPVGSLPEGWKAEATWQFGPIAKWAIIKDRTAPSGEKVLSITKLGFVVDSKFNLCWTDKIPIQDGTIEVMFKPISGKLDQGGGIMWRVQDRNNYYVVRFNPLEDNFRIYYVKDGRRVLINSANVSLKAGKWHSMKIVQEGERYQCYLDGKKYLEGRDTHFRKTGGVGLWTKSDAITSFDNFRVVSK